MAQKWPKIAKMAQKLPKMAQKLASAKKNSRDISPVSPTLSISDSMLHKKSKYIAQYAMHTPRIWLFLMLGIINYLWIDGKFYCLELPRNGNCGNCDNWDGEKEDCQWLENFLQRRANTFCQYTHHKIYRAGCLEDYEYMKSTKNQYTIL